jgi:glycosyltransferase involved in cell wall biosynthesis
MGAGMGFRGYGALYTQTQIDSVKHILIFIDWYEPAFKAGGPVRSVLNLISRMKGRYRFSVVASAFDYGDAHVQVDLPLDQWVERKHGEQVMYCTRLNYANCRRLIRNSACDVVYLQGMFSFRFGILPLLAARLEKKKVIIAPRGMLHPSALAIKAMKKRIYLKAGKMLGLYKGVTFQAVDEWESGFIAAWFPNSKVMRATNMAALPEKKEPLVRNDTEVFRMISIARISPEKNPLFLVRILGGLSFPVQAVFYGAPGNDTGYVRQFEAALAELPAHINAKWEGFLSPEELPAKMKETDWFVLPTLGENFGHAIFEAMAFGIPVIIGNNTPWKNLKNLNAGFDLPANHSALWMEILTEAQDIRGEAYTAMSAAAMQVARTEADKDSSYEQYCIMFGGEA